MKKILNLLIAFTCILVTVPTSAQDPDQAMVGQDLVFEETDGQLTIEAEHFYKQSNSEKRKWYRFSKNEKPKVGRDEDPQHCVGASNNSYIEVLPDTRVTHDDALEAGTNFCNEPGKMTLVHYKAYFNTPGRYYVWVRAFSTGTEDNGIHVGIDGTWPESGARMQWCEGKNTWRWESKQRTEENHCGVPHKIYLDVKKAGNHEIMFSLREDGFEFDKFVLSNNKDFHPETGAQTIVKVKQGILPSPLPHVGNVRDNYEEALASKKMGNIKPVKVSQFSIAQSNFYLDQKKWLAIDPNKAKEAVAEYEYKGKDGVFDITVLGVGENDGSSEYAIRINNKQYKKYKAPLSTKMFEENAAYCHMYEGVDLKKGDIIKVWAKVGTDGKEYSRARWAGIVISSQGSDFISELRYAMPKPALAKSEIVLPKVTGELKKWHKVTLVFDGPECAEDDEYNPFFNYRLNVTFSHKATGKKYVVPGYFAADGNAGMTSAKKGNKWKVHFAPDEAGEWDYEVDFKKGKWVAVRFRFNKVPTAGFMDGAKGKFNIDQSDKKGRDIRSHGRLQFVGKGYLQFAESGEYFYKCGPDAPENFLSYYAFDGDFASDGKKDGLVKKWEAHLKDWKEGDPTWSGERGKEMIGALNYLASKGLNSVSFITNNVEGDDQNVFPYTDYNTWDRFDCSKLDQWEMVFAHAQRLGIFLHFKTLEAENQGLFDNGGIGANTKLYYRELIARFGHHLALNWNLCEEVGDWFKFDHHGSVPLYATERRALAQYIYDIDPYHHHMVIHNGNWYTPMYGEKSKLTGASVQTDRADFSRVNPQVARVIKEAKAAGKTWAVACDEPGDHRHSLITDAENPEHFNARTNGLWGAMLAGGWGTEWYFGYEHPHSDLSCQDYRSRDLFWEMGAICINFFKAQKLPVTEMAANNELISTKGDFCLAKEGDTYLILLKKGGESKLDLKNFDGKFSVQWFDPRNGGKLQKGSKKTVKGSGQVSIGLPPNNLQKDWVILVKRK